MEQKIVKPKRRVFEHRQRIVELHWMGYSREDMRVELGLTDVLLPTFNRLVRTIIREHEEGARQPLPLSSSGVSASASPPATAPSPVPEPHPAQQEDRKRSTAAKKSAGDDEPYDVLLRMKESGTKAGW